VETRSNYVMVGAVTVALLAGVLLFIVWLAGLSGKQTKCYDIYFAQGVGGLNKGSNVSFSGVPVGQVSKISLLPNRPEFVWVRIQVDQQTPVLQGTSAQIHGVGFTGVSEIQLTGAERGRPPIKQMGPQGCAVIPATSGGISALLNSAPELIDRIQRLTERLTELLSDKNQNSISDILENIDATTRVLRAHAPEMAQTMTDVQVAAHNAGIAANNVAALSANTNRLVTEQGEPAAKDLRTAIAHVQQAADNLNAMVSDARPGVQNFSKSTLPEANKLVHDLRDLSQSLKAVSDRVNQQGIGGALGPEKLPDYKPGKRK
jgi:phospholipid/cholesterol/gamma-HCH transport system substrate-binding protein